MKEILTPATWMNVCNFMLSEISQVKKKKKERKKERKDW
jgi:hypothetical protein